MPPKKAKPAKKKRIKPSEKIAGKNNLKSKKKGMEGAPAKGKASVGKKGKGKGKGGKDDLASLSPRSRRRKLRAEAAKRGKRKKKGMLFQLTKRMCPGSLRPPLNRRSTELADIAMLTNTELAMLKTRFDEVDVDGVGDMDFDEFFEYVGEPRTPFTDAVFTLIDDPASHVKILDPEKERIKAEETGEPAQRVAGNLSFDDFVQLTCCYCRYTREDVLMFAFQAFDRDGSGVIDEDEFIELCQTVNNNAPTFPGNFKRAMEEFDKNDDGMIDFDEFRLLNQRYPLVLFPAFRLQDLLQDISLGHGTWKKVFERNASVQRVEEYRRGHNGKYPPVPVSTRIGRVLCPCFMPTDYARMFANRTRGELPSGGIKLATGDKKKKKQGGKKKKYYSG